MVCENLARAMDRRSFLKHTGETVFAGLAAIAAGHLVFSTASAGGNAESGPTSGPPIVPTCAPPGPYCNLNGINEPNGCHGGSCFQHLYNGQVLQCRAFYGGYVTGCWTTPVAGGYWVCCDCGCGSPQVTTCGCAQFSGSPVPRPDNPTGESQS